MRLYIKAFVASAVFVTSTASFAQMTTPSDTPAATTALQTPEPVAPAQTAPAGLILLPADSIVQVTPVADITSKKMKEGDQAMFRTVTDVAQSGVVVIPRGSSVTGKIIWRTGKGIGGKSAKFEVEFTTVNVAGKSYAMKGKHRQEGRGNTVAALLGSMLISGRSAVMTQGQIVNAFTAADITVGS